MVLVWQEITYQNHCDLQTERESSDAPRFIQHRSLPKILVYLHSINDNASVDDVDWSMIWLPKKLDGVESCQKDGEFTLLSYFSRISQKERHRFGRASEMNTAPRFDRGSTLPLSTCTGVMWSGGDVMTRRALWQPEWAWVIQGWSEPSI